MQELATPGEMRTAQSFDFEFKNVEKQYESYHGINVKLRYLAPLLFASRRSCRGLIRSLLRQGISFE